jgi:ankyrin repeat protein
VLRVGYAEIVDILIRFGADIHKPAVDQKISLHLASEKGHFMAASALINAGANIKAKGIRRLLL